MNGDGYGDEEQNKTIQNKAEHNKSDQNRILTGFVLNNT